MALERPWQLHHCHHEEVEDVLLKLENSFGIRFSENAFYDVKTFGEACTVIQKELSDIKHVESCTKQQAFYRIREAICDVQQLDKNEITIHTVLRDLIPKKNRSKKVAAINRHLNTDLKVLTHPELISWFTTILFILSLGMLLINWKIAMMGIIFSLLTNYIAGKTGIVFTTKTVGQLAEKAYRENYTQIRRIQHSVNRQEITPLIREVFIQELFLDQLTEDAVFSWAHTKVNHR